MCLSIFVHKIKSKNITITPIKCDAAKLFAFLEIFSRLSKSTVEKSTDINHSKSKYIKKQIVTNNKMCLNLICIIFNSFM